MSKKAIFLFGILFLILAAVVFWQLSMKKQGTEKKDATETTEAISVSDDTSKIYRSEKYGFELKYPKDWTSNELAGTSVLFLKSPNFKPVLMGYDYRGSENLSQGEITVEIFDNPKNLSIKNRYLEFDDITRLYFDSEKKHYKETKINNYDAVIFEPFSENNPNWKLDVRHKIVILKVGNKILSFDYIYTDAPSDKVINVLQKVVNSVSLLR